MIPWSYLRVLNRIEQKAEENRVLLKRVDPAYTSQTCSLCGAVSRKNRVGENFNCIRCGHSCDADSNAAVNILVKAQRFIGSVEPPMLENVKVTRVSA